MNKPLTACHVHVAGVGRVGSAIVLALHESGVGVISCNDPQLFEMEQLKVTSYAKRPDLGKPKVHVLERFLDGRPGLVFLPLVARNQSPDLSPHLKQADLIISCANAMDARLHIVRAALRLKKVSIQACVQDGRVSFGGTICVRRPNCEGACFGCFFPEAPARRDGKEVLHPRITQFVASTAANLAVGILSKELNPGNNVFLIDAQRICIDGLFVVRRRSCRLCGSGCTNRLFQFDGCTLLSGNRWSP